MPVGASSACSARWVTAEYMKCGCWTTHPVVPGGALDLGLRGQHDPRAPQRRPRPARRRSTAGSPSSSVTATRVALARRTRCRAPRGGPNATSTNSTPRAAHDLPHSRGAAVPRGRAGSSRGEVVVTSSGRSPSSCSSASEARRVATAAEACGRSARDPAPGASGASSRPGFDDVDAAGRVARRRSWPRATTCASHRRSQNSRSPGASRMPEHHATRPKQDPRGMQAHEGDAPPDSGGHQRRVDRGRELERETRPAVKAGSRLRGPREFHPLALHPRGHQPDHVLGHGRAISRMRPSALSTGSSRPRNRHQPPASTRLSRSWRASSQSTRSSVTSA